MALKREVNVGQSLGWVGSASRAELLTSENGIPNPSSHREARNIEVFVEKACMAAPPQSISKNMRMVSLRPYRWLIQAMNRVAQIPPREYMAVRRPSAPICGLPKTVQNVG